jgi:hypothetical protein
MFDPQTLVVGCYSDNEKNNINELLQIYGYNDIKKEYVLLDCLNSGHKDTITDVQWANKFGRSYHLIASSSKDGKVIIWKVNLKYDVINDLFDNIKLQYEKIYEYQHISNGRYKKEVN